MDKEKILELFKTTGALQHGHFRLTSGLHSPEYFQCAKVLQFPQYNELLCGEIARHFYDWKVRFSNCAGDRWYHGWAGSMRDKCECAEFLPSGRINIC